MGRYEEGFADPPAGDAAHDAAPAPAYEPIDCSAAPAAPEAQSSREPLLSTASPFAFPSPSSDPVVISDESESILAVPQVRPGPFPLMSAYSPMLLKHGITQQSWDPFLDNISAFLTARISSRFVSHAADMARDMTQRHVSSSRWLAARARETGIEIAGSARRGNLIGVIGGIILGIVHLPVSAALSIVGNAVSLPGAALGATFKTPRTPLERAANYVSVANGKWLHGRNLHAQLMQTEQLAGVIGVLPAEMLETARRSLESIPSDGLGLRAFHPRFEAVECERRGALHLETASLWLVVFPFGLDKNT